MTSITNTGSSNPFSIIIQEHPNSKVETLPKEGDKTSRNSNNSLKLNNINQIHKPHKEHYGSWGKSPNQRNQPVDKPGKKVVKGLIKK